MEKQLRSPKTRPRARRNEAISAITGKPIVLVLDVTKQKESQRDISFCPCGKKDVWCSECYGDFEDFICFE